jgi:predicted CXXCH cytochrome family protein
MRFFLLSAVLFLLLTSQAMGDIKSIKNSKHNLAKKTDSGQGDIVSTNYDEICVFCHTPHVADVTVTNAPLWNRSHLGTFDVTDLYNTPSLISGVSNPTTVFTQVQNSDAPLCLSCHDGSSLAGGLVNPTNAVTTEGSPLFDATTNAIASTSHANISGDAQELKNDHPIGMDYTKVLLDETGSEFFAVNDTGLNFFGVGEKYMWCSSCHDVHDNTYAPFLATDNAGSGLCLSCHNK